MSQASYWVEKLGLRPHPEGGYFRRTYTSETFTDLPSRFPDGVTRSFATAIYFLLESTDCSRMHRLKSDELWHFYCGSPLTVHMIDGNGNYTPQTLGANFEVGQRFQFLVPHGNLPSFSHYKSAGLEQLLTS